MACGRPPGQDVNILITMPASVAASDLIQPVHVSLRLSNFGNIFLNKTLVLGENRVFLPKGPFQIDTVFFAEKLPEHKNQPEIFERDSNENVKNELNFENWYSSESLDPFIYANVQQNVVITKKTRSLEVYYPKLKPVQYRKFGFIFKEKQGQNIVPLANTEILVQDPISEKVLTNPLNGNNLKIITDSNGCASVDLPIVDPNENIRLLIPSRNKYNKILVIPVDELTDELQFYEIVVGRKTSFTPLLTAEHYLEQTKTIASILDEGKNPRFIDVIKKDAFQSELNDEFKHSSETVDILKPFLKLNAQLRLDDPYTRSGRVIQIQCKPHSGGVYQQCDRYLSAKKLKGEFFPNSETEESVDFLFLDQDGFSIFNDKESTREKPTIVTVQVS